MIRKSLTYPAGGKDIHAHLAAPGRSQGSPGVIVLHAWWGLNPFFENLCERLAEQGFVALAPDLNDGQVARTVDEAKALLEQRDSGLVQQAAFGAVDLLRQQPGVSPSPLGVIGFSMGAAWSLILTAAFPQQFAAAVLFYGSNQVDFRLARAAYLGHFAKHDEWEPLEGIQQMEADMKTAGREAAFHFYPGVGHWFFEDDRPQDYHPQAATLAWERSLDFLKSHLKTEMSANT